MHKFPKRRAKDYRATLAQKIARWPPARTLMANIRQAILAFDAYASRVTLGGAFSTSACAKRAMRNMIDHELGPYRDSSSASALSARTAPVRRRCDSRMKEPGSIKKSMLASLKVSLKTPRANFDAAIFVNRMISCCGTGMRNMPAIAIFRLKTPGSLRRGARQTTKCCKANLCRAGRALR